MTKERGRWQEGTVNFSFPLMFVSSLNDAGLQPLHTWLQELLRPGGWSGCRKQRVSATRSDPQADISCQRPRDRASQLSHRGSWAACIAGWGQGTVHISYLLISCVKVLPRLHWRDPRGRGFTRLTLQSASFLVQCVYLPRTIFGVCS